MENTGHCFQRMNDRCEDSLHGLPRHLEVLHERFNVKHFLKAFSESASGPRGIKNASDGGRNSGSDVGGFSVSRRSGTGGRRKCGIGFSCDGFPDYRCGDGIMFLDFILSLCGEDVILFDLKS